MTTGIEVQSNNHKYLKDKIKKEVQSKGTALFPKNGVDVITFEL